MPRRANKQKQKQIKQSKQTKTYLGALYSIAENQRQRENLKRSLGFAVLLIFREIE
jgi:hypothetical protein